MIKGVLDVNVHIEEAMRMVNTEHSLLNFLILAPPPVCVCVCGCYGHTSASLMTGLSRAVKAMMEVCWM